VERNRPLRHAFEVPAKRKVIRHRTRVPKVSPRIVPTTSRRERLLIVIKFREPDEREPVRFKRLIRSPSCCCTLTDPRTLRPLKKLSSAMALCLTDLASRCGSLKLLTKRDLIRSGLTVTLSKDTCVLCVLF